MFSSRSALTTEYFYWVFQINIFKKPGMTKKEFLWWTSIKYKMNLYKWWLQYNANAYLCTFHQRFANIVITLSRKRIKNVYT